MREPRREDIVSELARLLAEGARLVLRKREARVLVERLEDVPAFRGEAEERAYWDTHVFGSGVLERLQPAREVDPRIPPTPDIEISVEIREGGR